MNDWERSSLDTSLQRDRWMVIASASKRDAGAVIDKSSVGFTSLIQGQGHVIADAQPRRALNHPLPIAGSGAD